MPAARIEGKLTGDFAPARNRVRRIDSDELVRDRSLCLKDSLEAPLLVPIVNQDDGRQSHRMLAGPADPRFTFEMLHEPVGEMTWRPRPPHTLGAVGYTMRAGELNLILERIAIKGRPPRIPYPCGL
jgi:hypothetical protein